LIFVQNRFRRRQLGNFENFRHLGGADCVFFEKIGGDGGSADRLTSLLTTTRDIIVISNSSEMML
jgi:hypothetical protein